MQTDGPTGAMTDVTTRRQIESIVQQALDLGEDDRATFIAAQCGSDEKLLVRVRRLLDISDDDIAEFLTPQVHASVTVESVDAAPAAVPARVGRYQVIGVLGEGGMGVVYEAR